MSSEQAAQVFLDLLRLREIVLANTASASISSGDCASFFGKDGVEYVELSKHYV